MATGDPKQFALDISAFVKRAKSNMNQVVRKIVLDVGTRIVMRSPVGDASHWQSPPPKGYVGGRFRSNWLYGEGVMPQGTLLSIDPKGNATVARLVAGVKPDAAGKVHWLVNSLPYAQRLEYGWSKRQAPAGMVGVTVVEYQSIVRNAAQEVHK